MWHGPSTRVNGWTQTPASSVIGPFVVSNTVYGSIRAVSCNVQPRARSHQRQRAQVPVVTPGESPPWRSPRSR